MHFAKMDRRELLAVAAGATAGTLFPHALMAQPGNKAAAPFPPKDAGPIHNDMLSRIGEALHGTEILTREGLKKIVGLLVEYHVVSKDDGELLDRLIDTIFAGAPTIAKEIQQLYDEALSKSHEVTQAIVSVARSSYDYAKKNPRTVYIVAQDLLGAMSGAFTGIKLGPAFTVAGALLGAVGSSAYAIYQTSGKPVSSLSDNMGIAPS